MRRHPVGQFLHPQHRLDPGDQRRLIDRLGQIFVGAGVKAEDDILGVGFRRHQNDRHERQSVSAFSRRHTSKPSSFGIITSSRIKSGRLFAGDGKRLLAIASLQELVALRSQSHDQNVAIGLVVIDDQNTADD